MTHARYLVDLMRTADDETKHTIMKALVSRDGHKPALDGGLVLLYDKCVGELYSMINGSGQPVDG